jgi:hypothetical protein
MQLSRGWIFTNLWRTPEISLKKVRVLAVFCYQYSCPDGLPMIFGPSVAVIAADDRTNAWSFDIEDKPLLHLPCVLNAC